VKKSWEDDGHEFQSFNLRERRDLRALERGNETADVAFICGWDSAEILKGSRMELHRAKFRAYITGEGWRRSEWQRRGLQGIVDMKPRVVFLSHRPHMDRYKKAHKRVFYVGLGFSPEIFNPGGSRDFRGRDDRGIVFCGNLAMGRERRLKLLSKKFPGRVEWRTGLSHSEMASFLRSAKIGWNQIAKGPKNGVSCNLRVYEILGCGAMMLCSRSRHVDFLEDGTHCVFWDNDEDMVKKADHYLSRDEKRERIARQGHEKAMANYTWDHRAREYKGIIERFL
jgi:glycosyltransferase involved in cell wall biosynthesis